VLPPARDAASDLGSAVDVRTLWGLSNTELAAVLVGGHPLEPEALCGSYRGISLGLPSWVDKLAWKAFRKVFRSADGVVGHNVRLRQPARVVPIGEEPAEPLLSRGQPVTFGPFRVRPLPDDSYGCRAGLLLDYAAMHPPWHPLGLLRDPLVAVLPGSSDLLLGASYLQVGRAVRTPSFFTLERER
jgi:hypothetical protein